MGREQTKDADGLTPQWRAVINHYLADPQRNKKAAYQQVYDSKRKQPDAQLRAAATRLFKHPAVKAYVDRRNADVAAALELTQERVVREWVRLGFFDVRNLFDAAGNLLPIQQLPDDVAAAGASAEVVAALQIAVASGHGIGKTALVTRELDPTKGRYRVRSPHRREMYWDWRGAEMDGSDWRFVVRRRWYDGDYLQQTFPRHGPLFQRTANDRADWDQPPVSHQPRSGARVRQLPALVHRGAKLGGIWSACACTRSGTGCGSARW